MIARERTRPGADTTVKQQLAAIRTLFDHLVVSQVVPFNPAHAVRGPSHVIKKGKTPVLTAEEASCTVIGNEVVCGGE